ncbi:LysE family translocator [Pectobacterium brasiliense]|uniref:LysE family translocator n=1 Tax=Pectobacterium brasiliense TaxID=180957 RepID=A0AAE2WD30_9GAMM|nr:LysE family translocator [Pectobacterium brasiliense]MBN3051033.1 LysE family translocator [Pectobacterium brasiliense]
MMNHHTLFIFCIITLTQTFSIGPAVALLLTNYFNNGLKSSLSLSIAFRCGEVVTLLTAFLITSLIHSSVILFNFMKVAGGAYLIFLGIKGLIKLIRKSNNTKETHITDTKIGFLSAFLVPLINPKALVFFTSFIPSFISINAEFSYGSQFFILSTIFVFLSFISDIIFLSIASIAKRISGSKLPYIINLISSIFLVGTGLFFVLDTISI